MGRKLLNLLSFHVTISQSTTEISVTQLRDVLQVWKEADSSNGPGLALRQIWDEFEQSENVNDFQQVPIFRVRAFSSFQKRLSQIIAIDF